MTVNGLPTNGAGVTTASLDESAVLDEAQGIVKHKYGPPWLDLGATGRVWAAILSRHFDIDLPDIPAEMVAVMMAGLKAIREAGRHKDDNTVDAIGYWLCVQQTHVHKGTPGAKNFDHEGKPC